LLTADTLAEQAAEAQAIINGYGFLPEQNIVQPSHWASFVPQAVAVTYVSEEPRERGLSAGIARPGPGRSPSSSAVAAGRRTRRAAR
jgi:hypothetical protein